MCKPSTDPKPEVLKTSSSSFSSFDTATSDGRIPKSAEITPTHSEAMRDTSLDWVYFLVPLLFYKVTPVFPIYAVAIARIVSTHLILSMHWQFVDKDNYLNKISQKQLQREKDDYLTAYFMHMWTQVGLQIVFPGMFFADSSEIGMCALETFMLHVCIVEPLYYLVHRWLHNPEQMKAMHGFHHLSIFTLPTTSLVQNFWEHFVYIATFGPAFLLPFLVNGRQHWTVIGGYLISFDIINAWGHTNVRVRHWIFTSKWSPLTYLFYTPEFHLGHHRLFNANYALFMPIWDYLFGTARPYQKHDLEKLLPSSQQNFVFIGHNGGLGHLMTVPELCYYKVYDDYPRTWLPLKMEFMIMHWINQIYRLFVSKIYTCSRFCIANDYIGRILVLARSPVDYMNPKQYDSINDEMIQLMKDQHKKFGTRYFGLGNLNKMKQLNDGGIEMVKRVKADPYLADKNIRVWTGDTMTVASIFNQIADIPNLDSLYYIGAGGKVGTAVCEMLVRHKPNLKIRIFSRNCVLEHPNISYSTDLSEMTQYRVVLAGKILSAPMYAKALKGQKDCKTRFLLDYTVPALAIPAIENHPDKIQHIRIGILKTFPNNPFLKGHYDLCMSHGENMIVPCHFGCILNTANGVETDEVGDIDQDRAERMWRMATARGFENITIDYSS